jgi:hypothetical protein
VAKTVRPFSLLVAALALGVFAAVGSRVGQSTRASAAQAATTWQAAAATTFSHARSGAYRLAWQQAYKPGWSAGIAAADSAATRAGRAAGRAEAATRALAASALAAVLAATPVRLKRGIKTDACVPVGGGLCEVLGPRVTGRRCPPASVPYPEGGVVCVPRVLLLAARMTNAPNLGVFTPQLPSVAGSRLTSR